MVKLLKFLTDGSIPVVSSMTDSGIDRTIGIGPSIIQLKLSCLFSVLVIFTLVTIVF